MPPPHGTPLRPPRLTARHSGARPLLKKPAPGPMSALVQTAPRPSIVVVDDEPGPRDLVRVRLELEGYDVRVARDGAAALALIAAQRPDLVLLDLVMPGVDGFDVLRRLKSDRATATIPVVVMSARADGSAVGRARASGAEQVTIKPLSIDGLLSLVEAVLLTSASART